MDEEFEILLLEYYTNLSEPSNKEYWKKELFEQKVYTKWAIKEIIREVYNSDKPILEVVEDFVNYMNEYSMKNQKTSRIFSIAYDAAMDLYDQMLYLKEELLLSDKEDEHE